MRTAQSEEKFRTLYRMYYYWIRHMA